MELTGEFLDKLEPGQTILFISGLTRQEPVQGFDVYVYVTRVRPNGFNFTRTGKNSVPSERVHIRDVHIVDEDSDEAHEEEVQRIVSLRRELKGP